MIGFGIRLAVAGGREALARFAVVAAAVALGTGLLLSTVSGVYALRGQVDRSTWLQMRPGTGAAAADPAVVARRWDTFDGRTIDRVEIGRTGPNGPVIPAVPRLPGPGEYYVSPALHDLIAAHPGDELAARFPGREAGLIAGAALTSPDSLVAVVGHTPDEVAAIPGSYRITSVSMAAPEIPVAALNLVLSVIAGGLLFPVFIFIGTATRLGAARREQRFAAMRLVGATPRQVSTLAAVEATAAAVLGTATGFALFPLLRTGMAQLPFTGERFFPGDLAPGWTAALIIAAGVPVAAGVAARLAMHRVRVSPLGVARRSTPKPPRVWRIVPVLAGLAELAYFVGRRPGTSSGQTAAFLPGFLVVMIGLVIAGPWITMVGARLMARRAQRLPTVVAARRLADNPQAAFRAISGVVLGLFVVSVATGVITTLVDKRLPAQDGISATTLIQQVGQHTGYTPGPVPDGLLDRLRGTSGVTFATVLHDNPDDGPTALSSVIACPELAKLPQYGRCAPGAEAAQLWSNLDGWDGNRPTAATVWPAAPLTAAEVAALPVDTVLVGLDASLAARERARTILEAAYPGAPRLPGTNAEAQSDSRSQMQQWRRLANVIMLFSLPIAGCSLAVSVIAGIVERKRAFSLLRLTGVPLRMLRRVVALESAVPLLAVAVLATAAGFGAAQLFLKAQMGYDLTPPGWSFYLLTTLGLAVSLAIIASTLPLLDRVTGPEAARNE